MARCCCGKYDLDPVYGQSFIRGDIVHQILGPDGNFCGPDYMHTIKHLQKRLAAVEAERDKLKANLRAMAEQSNSFRRQRNQLKDECERLRGDYNELVMEVSKKYQSETRHQTALRYIREAENREEGAAKAALREE